MVNNLSRQTTLADVALPNNIILWNTHNEKIIKNSDLESHIKRHRRTKDVQTVTIIILTTGAVSKFLLENLKRLGVLSNCIRQCKEQCYIKRIKRTPSHLISFDT